LNIAENSHDEELDAILGELSELETQFSREIGEEANNSNSNANSNSNNLSGLSNSTSFRKVRNGLQKQA
jgi:hypothetical protein